ncbi:MAG TPA: TraR/DksA C4-type zinc finger protein [bacterium]|nr:TraR/DksA C4-type zinc finger protein [bacterium]
MKQNFILLIKEKLAQEQIRLEKDLAGFTEKNIHNKDDYQTEYPDFGSDYDENAQEVTVFEERLSLEKTLEDELRDVKNSLAMIEQGKYGICKYCGKEIEEGRLLARPTSSSCVDCKKKFKGEV